ncbi:GNAT family N-acetyltransferase [Solibacillus sp. R5-41]|uniref:GNAT family N-acetyltransferase n=1 Tax=Solibacillus sp. R5-41 TaxID=2048654 RepID=UPI000C128032|nr:GNAT family N-acetyltransferase [Solibacillus sp. R5-41]ATP42062.1 GNAT family N-acetyltransferase [Solibacillus sp. R5-41]
MEFKLNKSGNGQGAFEYELDGQRVAEITWIELNGIMSMDHTYVSNILRGQGVAKKLLDAAANYAREEQLKMTPVCSYVVSAFEKSNEYDDVKA